MFTLISAAILATVVTAALSSIFLLLRGSMVEASRRQSRGVLVVGTLSTLLVTGTVAVSVTGYLGVVTAAATMLPSLVVWGFVFVPPIAALRAGRADNAARDRSGGVIVDKKVRTAVNTGAKMVHASLKRVNDKTKA